MTYLNKNKALHLEVFLFLEKKCILSKKLAIILIAIKN